jgi:hypothetical protein
MAELRKCVRRLNFIMDARVKPAHDRTDGRAEFPNRGTQRLNCRLPDIVLLLSY